MTQAITLDVRKAGSRVVMKPHQVKRDVIRSGKTSQAAARLAHYRLRKLLGEYGWMPVDDITLTVGDDADDFIRNQRTIFAETRCVDRLTCEQHGIGEFRLPCDVSVVRIPQQ